MWNKTWIAALASLALAACNMGGPGQPNDPRHALQDYISKSFAVKSPDDRNALLSYLAGEAKTRLAAWSEDQFRAAFIDSKRQFLKLALKEVKPVTANQVDVTYEITYLDQSKGHDAKVTNKKLCQMVLDQGRWLISDVHNIKELVEYQNELTLP